jgi:hypothetical protein
MDLQLTNLSFLLGLGAQQVGHDHCSHCAVKPGVGLEELLLLSGGLVFNVIKRHARFLELGVSGPLSWLGTGSQLGGQSLIVSLGRCHCSVHTFSDRQSLIACL